MKTNAVQGQFPGYMYKGKFYPAIMGGDTDIVPDVGTDVEEIDVDDVVDEGIEEDQGSQEHSLYDDFLKDVPEGARALIEPYAKQWDAQVTRKFQELNEKSKPYEELGVPLDELQQAAEIAYLLNTNPKVLYDILGGIVGESPDAPNPADGKAPIQEQTQDDRPEYVKAMEAQLQAQEGLLRALAERTLTEQQTLTQQQQETELDSFLEGLQKENEIELNELQMNFVLATMIKSSNPDEQAQLAKQAVETIKSEQLAIRQQVLAELQKQPHILSGSNVIPDTSQKVIDLPSKDVRSIVAQMVAQQNEAASG